MPLRFIGFEWDERNEEHIAEHSVTPADEGTAFHSTRKSKHAFSILIFGSEKGVADGAHASSDIIFMDKLMADDTCSSFLSYIPME